MASGTGLGWLGAVGGMVDGLAVRSGYEGLWNTRATGVSSMFFFAIDGISMSVLRNDNSICLFGQGAVCTVISSESGRLPDWNCKFTGNSLGIYVGWFEEINCN